MASIPLLVESLLRSGQLGLGAMGQAVEALGDGAA
jgi:hypothetical protein